MIRVGVKLPAHVEDGGDYLANIRALEAAGADFLQVEGETDEQLVVLGAIASVTERVRMRFPDPAPPSLLAFARGRAVSRLPEEERWVEVDIPADRAAWTTLLRDQEKAGVTGIVVPWDPRLIDLLRNQEPDDRSDLLMSTG